MTRVKRLELHVCTFREGLIYEGAYETNSTFFEEVFDFFPCLETLIYQQSGTFGLPIQNLISVLNSFGDVKNLSLSNLNIILTGLESYDKVKWGMESNIYQEAVKIIDAKFPLESTQITISARKERKSSIKYWSGLCEIVIKEKGSRPFLKVN